MRVAGLFAGIGGIELPFHERGHETTLLADSWEPSQKVLADRFPGVPLVGDVRDIKSLPSVDVVNAGFPCTDLSQAGRTAGIHGEHSGVVREVFRLLDQSDATWLVLENVRNMLWLDKGEAMRFLTGELERLGFRWAYRLVDSRFGGVPQRRHRVLFVASRTEDPRSVLFADDAGEPGDDYYRDDAVGFYWTEGLGGLGWAPDAVPPLKGGSGVGIASPPAIWAPANPEGRRLVVPSIEEAEQLQGFPRGWTQAVASGTKNGPRWKLVGNAVTTVVADWLASRLETPGEWLAEASNPRSEVRWPAAAWGADGETFQMNVSTWPVRRPYTHLADLVDLEAAPPLSRRATMGFLNRAARSRLRFVEDFVLDAKRHVDALDPSLPLTGDTRSA
ncbi:DNA cytosine methyltransferase [Egicoccus sp. AB-alg2]|uniref:DNA cytosine methyltransferase n=1 Tax=Egicoccus sp. AB-alg2 TaxID=3242693 RepID=UPI00359DF366